MKNTVEACLREIQYSNKRLSTTEKNVDVSRYLSNQKLIWMQELNAIVQDDKRVIDATSERTDEMDQRLVRIEAHINERVI